MDTPLAQNQKPALNAAPHSPAPKRSQRFKGWGSTIAILIIAPIVALMLTTFVFQSYEVDGPSMESTLSNHDRLIVVKTARTWARITRHAYIPGRGDVIIFNQNDLEGFGTSGKKQLIKRVIGLPGERVVVKDGVVTVYNEQYPDGFQPDKTLPYGKVINNTPGNTDVTLGKDQLFVCGDNRPNSLDSRAFGAINADQVVGKLALRITPIGKAKLF
ncbi:signal peptidase I [Candidatus Saccharibacteria bacterium RIFCSPHIGHO2_02_FULL_47_12]|nr:MAG: signal peptidase I [Candidatus Saccharibacteria bacterium RIFCSPHIGHO2_02_FULL_47_12]